MSRLDGLSETARKGVSAAAIALDAGRVDEASQLIADVLVTNSSHPEVLRMVAGVKSMRGSHQEAIRIMRAALEQRPDDAAYHNTMGTILGNAGEYDEAIESLRRTCSYQPNMALAWYNLGVMLTRSVRNDEAIPVLEHAIQLDSDLVRAHALLADLFRMQGKVAEAALEYRRIISKHPSAGMAWWGLADLRTVEFHNTDIAAMQHVLRNSVAGDDDLIAIGFALARALDQKNRYAESLAAIAQANTIAQRRQRWDRFGYSKALKMLHDAFSATIKGAPDTLGENVIFIVGLPRSGSTLVEHILASHSAVAGAGELSDLPQVIAEESRRRGKPFPRWVDEMRPHDWERLGKSYLERTAHWRSDRSISTDKLPSNWVYIGAIRAMLPGARIIGCRRDPLETCFSCYRQRLDNNEYTRDFEDLASFWRECDQSLKHWSNHDPDRVTAHSYESLLADTEGTIRNLIEFCGLVFEDACLSFHENDREVRSPSATQVRRPLQKDTRHAERYGALLDPLRIALGMDKWRPI